jgi:superfamily II DNA/RNA helicase
MDESIPDNQINQNLEDFRIQEETIELLNKDRINKLFFSQKISFDDIYDGEDVLLNSQPGTGKTLAYLLPILERLASNENVPEVRTPRALFFVSSFEQKVEIINQIKRLTHDKNSFLKYETINRIESLDHDIVILTYSEADKLVEEYGDSIQNVETMVFDNSDQLRNNLKFANFEKLTLVTNKMNKKCQHIFIQNDFKEEYLSEYEKFLSEGYKFHNSIKSSSFVKKINHQYIWSEGLYNDFNSIVKHIITSSSNSKKVLVFIPNESNFPYKI